MVRTPSGTLRNSGSACRRWWRSGLLQPAAVLALALLLAACGSDSDGGNRSPEAFVRTLAYPVSACRGDDEWISESSQKFVIQRDGREVVVKEWHYPPLPGNVMPGVGLCHSYGLARYGGATAATAAVQRLAVSPDASTVVFEVTDDHSILLPDAPEGLIPPEDEGFFVVYADGTGLRRLGDASRAPCWSLPRPFRCFALWFSPEGRKVSFTDIGPDENGQEATQIFTMDLATGERTQVTRLPPPIGPSFMTARPWFKDGKTLRFWTETDAEGLQRWLVKADGSESPTPEPTPAVPEALKGAEVSTDPRITDAANVVYRAVKDGIAEIYVVARKDPARPGSEEETLQLTSFGRPDTGDGGSYLDADTQTVLFFARADPLGTNPLENLQLFSIDTLGGNLRQLTQWNDGEPSDLGCLGGEDPLPECYTEGFEPEPRPGPDTVIFETACYQFGKNLNSGLFAIRADGTGLRRLTHTRGAECYPDGTVSVELAGTWHYPVNRYE